MCPYSVAQGHTVTNRHSEGSKAPKSLQYQELGKSFCVEIHIKTFSLRLVNITVYLRSAAISYFPPCCMHYAIIHGKVSEFTEYFLTLEALEPGNSQHITFYRISTLKEDIALNDSPADATGLYDCVV